MRALPGSFCKRHVLILSEQANISCPDDFIPRSLIVDGRIGHLYLEWILWSVPIASRIGILPGCECGEEARKVNLPIGSPQSLSSRKKVIQLFRVETLLRCLSDL